MTPSLDQVEWALGVPDLYLWVQEAFSNTLLTLYADLKPCSVYFSIESRRVRDLDTKIR